jgi:uncharacterized protein with PQ loop repeat
MVINLFQLAGGIILSIGNILQIRKIIKTKSVDDFDFKYLLAICVGIGFMEIYAIYNLSVALMFFITNTTALLLGITILLLYVKYKQK